MANALEQAIRRLCLAFPETEAFASHGMQSFRIRGAKTFATYTENHHGDGRIALWLNVPDGMQDAYVHGRSKHFFVPPYVGPSGWLGVRLDLGISWKEVERLVRSAYEKVAPPRLRGTAGAVSVPAPKRRITVADIDPMNTTLGKRVLAVLRKICLALPDTSEGLQFGCPVWRAGKKVFAQAYVQDGRWRASFWVGIPAQSLMTSDPRFQIPPYTGHMGWIALDVSKSRSESELRSLALESYRHFALKKMLAKL